MQRIVYPRESCLFDPDSSVLTETTCRDLAEHGPRLFRHGIPEPMPVDVLRGHFSPARGRSRVFLATHLQIIGWSTLWVLACAKMGELAHALRAKRLSWGVTAASGPPTTTEERIFRSSTVSFLISWAAHKPYEADF